MRHPTSGGAGAGARALSARIRLGVLGAALTVPACIELSAPTDAVESLSTVLLPYPAVVIGDTLRDSLGVARRLDVVAFTGRGDTVRDPAGLAFFLPDTGTGTRIENGYLIAGTVTGAVSVVAQVAGLQTPAATIQVVVRPTLARAEPASLGNPATLQTKQYRFESAVRSDPLQVRVQGEQNGTPTDVNGWIVTYTISRQPVSAVSGSLPAILVAGDGRTTRGDSSAAVDTTSGGLAARFVELRPGLLTGRTDTVFVRAHVRYHGVEVAGSPVEFRVPFAGAP